MKYLELNKKIDEMQGEIIAGIQENIRINSVKGVQEENAPFGKGPKLALENAINQAQRLGISSVNIDNKIGYAEIGEGDEMVAILGHLDIVPLGDGWDYDPLGGEIHNGIMYGRGVADDKGPTIGALYALKAIKDLGINHGKRIRVIFGTDEESGSACVSHYIKSGQEMPVAGFTPDADYPIINAEKGMIGLTLKKSMNSNENYEIIKLEGGIAKNVVMPSAKLCMKTDLTLRFQEMDYTGEFEIEVEGKPAHASTPEKGDNALLKMFKNIENVEFEGDFKLLADFVNKEINQETNGKTLGIFCEDKESGELTMNLGMVEYSNGDIKIKVDIRYPVTKDAKYIIDTIKQKASLYGIEVLEISTVDPLYVPAESELIQKLSSVYESITSQKTQLIGIGGGTYAKSFPNMVAFGPEFPGEDNIIHQANENMSVESLMKSIKISAAAILELAN